MTHLQEKHQQEMILNKKQSEARIKCLEEEHNLRMKILEKEYLTK